MQQTSLATQGALSNFIAPQNGYLKYPKAVSQKSFRHLFLLMLTFGSFLNSYGQREVITQAGKVTLEIHKGKYVIETVDQEIKIDSSKAAISSALNLKGMTLKLAKQTNIHILSVFKDADINELKASFKGFEKNMFVQSIGGVLVAKDGSGEQGITNRINCKLKSSTSKAAFEEVLKGYLIDSVIKDKDPERPFNYTVVVAKENSKDALDVANELNLTGLFDFADVDWIRIISVNVPIQPDQQWGIKNDGSFIGAMANADMKVLEAWKYATGKGIKIAVLDDGIDPEHPDLKANLLNGYNAVLDNTNYTPMTGDSHGTACAGIIAALNNDVGGIGVAYDAKIIPVKVGYGDQGYGKLIMVDSKVAKGIKWAAQDAKADIISCSWSGCTPGGIVKQELEEAMKVGPSKRGALVVFSAGNQNVNYINFPANVPGVIAVGASTMCDTRKRSGKDPKKVSCDKDISWGSNYGNDLCVIAPGVKILTTDISGATGYSSGDYYLDFGGTSAAGPNVAAVLALILEAKPEISAAEARKILELTTDQVDQNVLKYTSNKDHPTKAWNDEVGYGRVNALSAVMMAKGLPLPKGMMIKNKQSKKIL